LIEDVLVTGGHGRLGKELQKLKPEWAYPTHAQMDFTKEEDIEKWVCDTECARIIHLGAMTSVTQCQNDRKSAWKVNVEGVKNIVYLCEEYDLKLTYISTPCIFDGESAPYNELSIPNPKNYYGFTKAVAEQIVSTLPDYQIIRSNFVPKEKWPFEGAYINRFGTYLYAHDLAWWIINLETLSPIVHICGDKRMSMYELARLTTPNVKPIRLEENSYLTKDMSLNSITIIQKLKLDGTYV